MSNTRRRALLAEIMTKAFIQNPGTRIDQMLESAEVFLNSMDKHGLSKYIAVEESPLEEHVCTNLVHLSIDIEVMSIGTLPIFQPQETKIVPDGLSPMCYAGEHDDRTLQFAFCADCGKINGQFPLDVEQLNRDIEVWEKVDDEDN